MTLQLLFVVHFGLPFVVLGVMLGHLGLLHRRGSTSVIYRHSGVLKCAFYPLYWVKDLLNVVVYLALFSCMLLYPYAMGEVELFESANLLSSPAHIVPEWYFCVSYAILRRVPNKGIGVLIILSSVGILFLYPYTVRYVTPITLSSSVGLYLVGLQLLLTYLGFSPISQPFVYLSLLGTILYFLGHGLTMMVNLLATMAFRFETSE